MGNCGNFFLEKDVADRFSRKSEPFVMSMRTDGEIFGGRRDFVSFWGALTHHHWFFGRLHSRLGVRSAMFWMISLTRTREPV